MAGGEGGDRPIRGATTGTAGGLCSCNSGYGVPGIRASLPHPVGYAMPGAVLILAVAAFATGAAHGVEGQVLLQKYDCYICHGDTETKTGPAFVEVATRYGRSPQAAATLTAMVKKGAHGSGPWHMPPMPQVPDADARKIAEYILALEP
jgi:cytochrome c